MLKQVVLLKRRPGMSREEFIDYYENHHSKLIAPILPMLARYVRRYVCPEINPITGQAEELDFDVVSEFWWRSRADFDAAMAKLATGDTHRLIWEDEERIFNSHNHRSFTVEEYETDMESVA